MPAAWCGISGMKQTFGRVPKSGCVPLGFSYDHRAFDGVTASRFLARVRDALQDRDWAAELG